MKRKFMTLEDAAARFPVGTQVRYFPIAGEPGFRESRVRSEPWALGHGQVVVAIDGTAGGVAVEHLKVAQ